jgi:hypothetical protein
MIPVDRSALRSTLFSLAVASIALFGTLSAAAQTPAVAPRITQAIDETNLVTLKGNTHPLARAQYDQGAAPDSEPADRIQLLLKRSPAQEAALRQLLDAQKSAASPNFHQWLTPEQFGQQFGPSDSDIQTITSWLTSHGFTVNRVSAGRTVIEFSGTAGQVRDAFHTEIHKYLVNGQAHWANNSDPQIPAALASVVAGPVTLHNFGRKAMHVMGAKISMAKPSSDAASPELTGQCTNPAGNTINCYVVAPADFATIYNTQSLWNQNVTVGGNSIPLDGTGQTIAIVGDSDINCSDVINFRTTFKLPTVSGDTCSAANSNVQIITDGPDPGFDGDEIEADLDVEWSGAVAKGAHIDFVTSEETLVSQGVDLSAEYIIDNNLAPVMSESFGDCEEDLGNAGNNYYATLWEQAAAQGITVMTSAGDSGAAGCDDDNTQDVAFEGLAVSGISSTPFNVSVGGTDFNDFTTQTTYWNSSDQTDGQSVNTGTYIPEIPWDDSCAALSLTGCAGISVNAPTDALNIVGGGGGQSNCAAVVEVELEEECEGYAKPSWQKGNAVAGLDMTDGLRDVPDVSLFAAAGSGSNSFYPICESDVGATCTSPSFEFVGVGGTSSSSPAFAGIMAMVNENMSAQATPVPRQGNANYELYTLASNQTAPGSACSSASITTSTGACTFYDILTGSNSVPCIGGYGCSVSNTSSTTAGVTEEVNGAGNTDGILAWQAGQNYNTSTGGGAYSPAIGLGSVNAFNLVHGWPAIVGAFTPTTTSLKMCEGSPSVCITSGTGGTLSFVHGATVTVTVTESSTSATGNAALIGTPNTLLNNGGSTSAAVDYFAQDTQVLLQSDDSYDLVNADIYPLSGGAVTGTTNYLVGGNYNVTAHYGGDGTFGASTSPSTPAVNVNISPEGSTTTILAGAFDPSSGDSVSPAVYGLIDVVHVDVIGSTSKEETASGTVNITDGGAAFGCPGTCTLNPEGNLEIQAGVNVIPTLSTGSHSFVANYTGDASYSASSSGAGVALTVGPAPTSTTVSAAPATVASGQSTVLTAVVATDSVGVAPTGTVEFFANGTQITTGTVAYLRTPGSLLGAPGTSSGVGPAGVSATLNYTPSATTTITAEYVAGSDPNYTSSAISGGATLTVTGSGTGVVSATTSTVTASPTSVVSDGVTTSTITVTLKDSNSNPVAGKIVTLSAGSGASVISAASGTSSSAGVVTFTVKDATAQTVVYTARDTTDGTTITGTASVTFVPYVITSPNSSAGTEVNIAAAGDSGTSTLSVAVGTGQSVTLSYTVSPSNLTDPPTCTFTINPVTADTNNEVLMCNTTAQTPPSPFARPDRRGAPLAWVAGALTALVAILFLLALPERRRGYALLIFVLVIAAGAGVACGGGGSSGGGGGGGGGGGATGTTVDTYQVTVTGSVAGGTPVTVFFNVQ